jgi:hypothetical protein
VKFRFEATLDQTRLPEGAYHAEITEASEVTSKNGNHGIQIKFAAQHNEKIVTIYDNLWATPGALPIVQQRLAAVGMPHNNDVDIQPRDLVGKRVVITIRNEEYGGETRSKVWNWSPEDTDAAAPASNGAAPWGNQPDVDDDIPF